jgi:hypothetical protein
MLFAVTGTAHWLLWAVPGVPLFVMILAAARFVRDRPAPLAFPRARAQLDEDMQLFGLKEAEL